VVEDDYSLSMLLLRKVKMKRELDELLYEMIGSGVFWLARFGIVDNASVGFSERDIVCSMTLGFGRMRMNTLNMIMEEYKYICDE